MTDKAEFEIELIDDVTRPARKAESSLQRLKKSLNRFNDSAIGKITQRLASVSRTALTVGGAIAVAIGAGIGVATVKMVDFAQRSRQAFGLLAKQGEVPEQLFKRSVDLASRLGLSLKDTTKQIQKFRALQFSQDQAEALIKMGADMQALGASTDEVSRVWLQLGQIQAKGRLQGEELTTLAESGVSTQLVLAALEKQLGKTRGEVQKLLSSGQIGSSDALNAIGTAILAKTGTKQFGQAGEQMATSTLSGMTNVLMAKGQGKLLEFAERVEPKLMETFEKVFGKLNKFFDSPKAAELMDRLVVGMEMFVDLVDQSIPLIEEFLAGFEAGATQQIKDIAGAFSMFTSTLNKDGKQAAGIAASLGRSMGEIAAFGVGATIVLGSLAGWITFLTNTQFNVAKSVFGGLIEALGKVTFAVTNWFDNIRAVLTSESISVGEKFKKLGEMIVVGLAKGISGLGYLPVETMADVSKRIVGAVKTSLGIQSPSKVFEDIGKNTAIGFSLGLQDLPTQNIIHSTLGNDNGLMSSPVKGNLAGGEARAIRTGGGSVRVDVGGIYVSPPPGMTSEQAKDLGRTMGDEFFSRIHEYFDDMVLEEAV